MSAESFRIERDSLGELAVPAAAYYGIQTARAVANFPVSGLVAAPELVRAAALVKRAAAEANVELGLLDAERGRAIIAAAGEILAGRLADQLPVDVFQAGAGTSFNMNVNEVIANRALELLGHRRGDYARLSPNDHVNMAQSSNDTFPTMCHLAVIFVADRLQGALGALAVALGRKADEFRDLSKSGRTHLMDALPVTLGAEFGAYASAVTRAAGRLEQRRDDLLEVALGGTAVGTGANAHPRFAALALARLGAAAGLTLAPARDRYEALQSRAQLAAFSGALRELAQELGRIANDLRLLNSGPVAGLGEISLPAVQPGSSIMPGKVNPSMPECLNMICFQVIGNDAAVAQAAGAGQLELNIFAPVMVHNILESMRLLERFLPGFVAGCIDGIRANETRCRQELRLNPALATLLVPRIGYSAAAALAKEALARSVPVAELAVAKGIVTPAEAKIIFEPGPPD